MLLATMVTVLKLTGASLGWGIQFQNPWFIGLMVAVTFIFALNLFGAFELFLPSAATGRLATTGGTGLTGSFCEGVFATLLATPCSAPFLGTAVAFALGAPLHSLWLIFLMLGVGMSLPWLFVALIPKTALLLPKRPLDEYPEGDSGDDAGLQPVAGDVAESASGRDVQPHPHAASDCGRHCGLCPSRSTSSPLFWVVVIALAVFGAISCAG